MYVCVCVCKYVCVYVYTYVCMCVFTYVCPYIRTHVCTTYIQVCMQSYRYTEGKQEAGDRHINELEFVRKAGVGSHKGRPRAHVRHVAESLVSPVV